MPRILSWAEAGNVARSEIAIAAKDVVRDKRIVETSFETGSRSGTAWRSTLLEVDESTMS
jgi:hypothetical protein